MVLKKGGKLKNTINQTDNIQNIICIIRDKITYIQEIIRNTIYSINKNKNDGIFSNNEANLSINVLCDLFEKTKQLVIKLNTCETKPDIETLLTESQTVIDKVSMIICGFGTKYLEDLLFISFGSEFKNMQIQHSGLKSKFELIKKYIQPTGYKVLHWKSNHATSQTTTLCSNKITDDEINFSEALSFECFDIDNGTKLFYQRVYGIRVIIQNEKSKKSLLITGIIEDIQLDCLTNEYINTRIEELKAVSCGRRQIETQIINRMINTMTLKDVLIHGNNDVIKKMFSILHDVNTVKNNKLDITMKTYLDLDIYSQRGFLLNLLIYDNDNDINYICYLLYEMLSVNSSDEAEAKQLHIFYESLPWKIKTNFKEVIKHAITNANQMMQKYDVNHITLEQQIYLMKADDIVKEKAMVKLKEIKGRPDEMGLKAKQYLEGLIKIPFGVYREEPILKEIKILNEWYRRILNVIQTLFPECIIPTKSKYTVLDIIKGTKTIIKYTNENLVMIVRKMLDNMSLKQIHNIIQQLNTYAKLNSLDIKLSLTSQAKSVQINKITEFVEKIKLKQPTLLYEIYDKVLTDASTTSLTSIIADTETLNKNIKQVENTLSGILNVLDNSIYAHKHAKNQIMKIVGQWMNGEQTGYCFGFEGAPGIGKTSLAKKGLSQCLKHTDGSSRPFAFIAIGGSCNGSTLEGHGYTYMNSTWGKIVDILMETKCMNPIIYIDELDKVSKTENGREIIGIFTHLIDQTQNDTFQDKYFSGINIDLSKALFIFSYNDPEQIDRILLDRIHRIKFENLTLDDKMVIVKKYILPELNNKMGFDNIVELSDEIIEHIIEKYTMEPGVRKLKELLFDLFGEINLDILKRTCDNEMELPIKITEDILEHKYLTKYHKVIEKTIHKNPEVGIINGLWANSLGKGGIIPIQTLLYPSSSFLELRLTGLQGDVMKESMNVAKTLAWNLTPNNVKTALLTQFNDTKCQGLHIHCPEGAISKDGPSAGTAITVAIFSIFNNKKIHNDLAITGEINLQGEVTAIGGLGVKLSGGIRAGIKTFLYPASNHRDFIEWKKNEKAHDNITFHMVSTIQEVFTHVFL
jgi:hypothetical protein